MVDTVLPLGRRPQEVGSEEQKDGFETLGEEGGHREAEEQGRNYFVGIQFYSKGSLSLP